MPQRHTLLTCAPMGHTPSQCREAPCGSSYARHAHASGVAHTGAHDAPGSAQRKAQLAMTTIRPAQWAGAGGSGADPAANATADKEDAGVTPAEGSRGDNPEAACSVTNAPGTSVTVAHLRGRSEHKNSPLQKPNAMVPPNTSRNNSEWESTHQVRGHWTSPSTIVPGLAHARGRAGARANVHSVSTQRTR